MTIEDSGVGQGEPGSTPSEHVGIAAAEPAPHRDPMTAREIAGESLGALDITPSVAHQAWLKEDDYWQRTTFVAATGRQTAVLPKRRRLPRPTRFQSKSPWSSLIVLGLTVALMVLIPLGVLLAQREGESLIRLPTTLPFLVQPTPTNTPHAKPTLAPKSN